MNNSEERAIIRWMMNVVRADGREFLDVDGTIKLTQLGEAALAAFNLEIDENLGGEHVVFDLAYAVALEWEHENGR